MQKNSATVSPQGYHLMLAPVSRPSTAVAPSTEDSPRLYRAMLGLAAAQIVLMMIVKAWVAVLWAKHFLLGVWGFVFVASVGVVVITTGSIGIAASKRKNKCLLIAFMVLCIISATLLGCMLICFSISLATDVADYRERLDTYDWWYPDYYYDIDCNYNDYGNDTAYDTWSNETYPCPMADMAPITKTSKDSQYHLVLAMYGLVLIFGVAQLVAVVVASAFSCKATCNCSQQVQPSTHIAYMVPVAGGYRQPTVPLYAPTVVVTEPKMASGAHCADMYPIDIPIEPWDVGPTHQNQPPSYTSLADAAQDAQAGKAMSKVHVV